MKLGILNARFFFPSSNPRTNNYSEGVKNFVSKLLSKNPSARGNADDGVGSCQQLLSVFDS